ncbi:MAG: hypothetical protein SGJ20_05655 [Planctomycetota bacterium]|nr:hypothetical protein [Planctomycetota bacterium]
MSDAEYFRSICRDSSHWVGLIRDLRSPKRHGETMRMLYQLETDGWGPLFPLHHLAELLQHGNEQKATQRLLTLRTARTLDTIRGLSEFGVGSVGDALGRGLCAVTNTRRANADEVVKKCQAGIVQPVSAEDICATCLPRLSDVRQRWSARAQRSREISMFSRAKILDQSKAPFNQNGKALSPEEVRAHLKALEPKLEEKLSVRRDPRASDAEVASAATQFVESLAASAGDIAQSAAPDDAMRPLRNLTQAGAAECRAVGALQVFMRFLHNVAIILLHGNALSVALSMLRQDKFPTWIVHRAVIRHRLILPKFNLSKVA